MLTRKDYKAIAAIIKSEKHLNRLSPNIPQDLAEYMANDNPKFDRDRFMDACGFDRQFFADLINSLNPRI